MEVDGLLIRGQGKDQNTMKSCYYCNDPGTETMILGNITYSFCPNHKQVILSMIEEDQQRKQQQLAATVSQAKK